jgi:hypothetical protein
MIHIQFEMCHSNCSGDICALSFTFFQLSRMVQTHAKPLATRATVDASVRKEDFIVQVVVEVEEGTDL